MPHSSLPQLEMLLPSYLVWFSEEHQRWFLGALFFISKSEWSLSLRKDSLQTNFFFVDISCYHVILEIYNLLFPHSKMFGSQISTNTQNVVLIVTFSVLMSTCAPLMCTTVYRAFLCRTLTFSIR